MSERPRLSSLHLWERHQRRVLDALREALPLVTASGPHHDEPALNRLLYRALIKVIHAAERAGREAPGHPTPEARNPPFGSAATPETREFKIPDFQWCYIDAEELDDAKAVRQFAVECKRLGERTESGWALIEQYVAAGICRFTDNSHGYGKDSSSGAMVGYLQNMSFQSVAAELALKVDAQGLPTLSALRNVGPRLQECEHHVIRPFPVSPFLLVHLWVDLR